MRKTFLQTVRSAAVLALFSATLPALAADLVLTVDNLKNSVAVTNTLSTKVTLLYLKSLGDDNLPLFANLDSGATVDVPLHFTMPPVVAAGVCDVDQQRRYLTVEVR